MKRFGVLTLLLGFLLQVASAEGKAPPNGFRVCGAGNACVTIAQDDAERLAISLFYGASTEIPAPATGPSSFFVLRWEWRAGDSRRGYYVPGASSVRLFGSPTATSIAQVGDSPYWLKLEPHALTALGRITDSLVAFKAPVPIRVTVAGKAVRDPASYASLWSIGSRVSGWPPRKWLRIRVTGDVSSPWTDAVADLRISRRGSFLMRDGTTFRIPAALAARIRAGKSLR